MTFDEFKQEVVDKIKDFLPVEYQNAEVEIKDVIKNNDTHLSGLTIHKEDTGISPTLYLEDFYNAVENGEHSMNGVLSRMSDMYVEADNNDIAKDAKSLVENITDYEATKDKIVPRVVNRESNEERLKGMPHTDVGNDLAVTYHVDLGNDKSGQMSVAISNEMMEKYGVSVGELHDQACANMEHLSPTQIKGMSDTLAEIMIPNFAEMSQEEREQTKYEMGINVDHEAMYVITNSTKVFGAAALLDSDSMDKIQEQIGEFYILPSSVHECILVPKTEEIDLATLENMVQEVNSTQVAPNEVLSDHVYAYDSETKEIYRADQEAEHLKEKETAREAKGEKAGKAEKTAVKAEEKKERPSLKARLEDKKKESKELAKDSKEKEIGKNTPKRGGDAL